MDIGYDYTVYATGYGGSGSGSGKGYYIKTKGTAKDGALDASYDGVNGVGGVIIIYCETLETTNAKLIANGYSSEITYGKAYTSTASSNGKIYAGGGGSGGGSVNIFYKNISNTNLDEDLIIDVSGQGTGGNGTYNIGSISTGKYVNLKTSN